MATINSNMITNKTKCKYNTILDATINYLIETKRFDTDLF